MLKVYLLEFIFSDHSQSRTILCTLFLWTLLTAWFIIYSDPQMMMTGASHETIAPDEFQIPRVITPFPAPKLSHLPMVLYSRLFLFCTFLLLVFFFWGNLNLELLCFKFEGDHKESLYWGTYRPQVYFGVRAR